MLHEQKQQLPTGKSGGLVLVSCFNVMGFAVGLSG
jgi:hypothetical protein